MLFLTMPTDRPGLPSFGLRNRTIHVYGDTYWDGDGSFVLGDNATFNNRGTFAALSGAYMGGGFTSIFNNFGTFIRGGNDDGGETRIASAFNNSGVVNVEFGTLKLSGGGTSTGAWDLTDGASLHLSYGTFTFNAGSVFSDLPSANAQALGLSVTERF